LLDFDRNPRATASRIRAALMANGCAREISPEIGCMARALAASKMAGTFLCIGAGAGEIGGWVLDAMDYSSGLVTLVQDRDEAVVLERELDRDVRASVHRQDVESFLLDVHAHRFDLIVDLIADEHPRAVLLGLNLLQAGGVYLAAHPGNLSRETFVRPAPGADGQPSSLEADEFEIARLGDRLDSLILVRRAVSSRRKRRSDPRAR
jgi:predicted O-methyltransferase YrrM